MELAGKVAVVTGASSGIGWEAALALADAGMTVVAAARRVDRLTDLEARHADVRAHPVDVTSQAQVDALAARVRDELGACHVLVNNAGAGVGQRFRGPEDVDEIARSLDVNFLGAVRVTAALADLLRASAPARVVNVASIAGKLGVGAPGYTAAKFALVGFTEAVGLDWARDGVRLCQLNPGFIRTEGFPQDDLVSLPVVGRLVGRPGDVAAAIVEVARSGARERTVPRWYRPLSVLRHTSAPLFWAAAARLPRR